MSNMIHFRMQDPDSLDYCYTGLNLNHITCVQYYGHKRLTVIYLSSNDEEGLCLDEDSAAKFWQWWQDNSVEVPI